MGGQMLPTLDAAKLKMFAPLPETVPLKTTGPVEAQVVLGRMLFYDTRLSKSQTIACNSCHDLSNYGVDGEPTSEGFKGQRGDRNSPTVYNAAAHFVQFWDGRASDVEAGEGTGAESRGDGYVLRGGGDRRIGIDAGIRCRFQTSVPKRREAGYV